MICIDSPFALCFLAQTPKEAASIKVKVLTYIAAVRAKEAEASGAPSPCLSAIDPTGKTSTENPSPAAAVAPLADAGSVPLTENVTSSDTGDAPH